jgi:hypothetical protein
MENKPTNLIFLREIIYESMCFETNTRKLRNYTLIILTYLLIGLKTQAVNVYTREDVLT